MNELTESDAKAQSSNVSSPISAISIKNNQTVLATAQVTVYSRQGVLVLVNAPILLDNGSEI